MKKIWIAFIAILTFNVATAQEVNIEQLISSKKFTFHATNALPQNSNEISKVFSQMQGAAPSSNFMLDPTVYAVEFSEELINSYLPFYGRVYSSEISSNDNGLKFKSTSFTQKIRKSKKGNYQVDYQIKDARAARSYNLSISPGGSATLLVVGNNRATISFNGYVKERN